MKYNEYINGNVWKEKRAKFLELHKYCQSILHKDTSVEAVEVNHLNYDHFGNEREEDLQALCADCHEKIHTTFSYNKSETILVAAANEMTSFYYNSRTNHDGVYMLLLNTISDNFYDGRKLLTYFDHNTTNYFFQNIVQDLMNKNNFVKMYNIFERDIRDVSRYTPKPKVTEATQISFDEFLKLSNEEKNDIELSLGYDEGYDELTNYTFSVKPSDLSTIKSRVNNEYLIKFYKCNVFFNQEGLGSLSAFQWFIDNKTTNYLKYLLSK